MRSRRRNNLKLLLFVLLISISLGYAFLQTDLTINGTSKITATSWDIHFDHVQVTQGSVSLSTGDVAPTIDTTTGTDLTYTVTLHNPGDFYEFTVDVVNAGTLDGMIDTISSKMNGTTISTLPAYMNYSITYDNDMPIKEKHLLASGITETIKVRLEYRTDINPEDLPTSLETKTLSFGISYIQNDGTAITRPTPPIIKTISNSDRTAFRSDAYRRKIKTITLGEEINPPEDYIESWDIGQDQNGNVMAYVTQNQDDNTMYDLYIQGDGALYANPDSSYLFAQLTGVDVINNIEALDTSNVVNMSSMFYYTGSSSTIFTLDLGDKFDTSNVTNMRYMFSQTGYSSQAFTLDLGNKFDTSNITDMQAMFSNTGYSSPVFTLDLGDKFDTSNVVSMGGNSDTKGMFSFTGYSSTVFTLDLGDKFDTSKVTDMRYMFYRTGFSSPVFTLDLGNNFDTSNVTNMSSMFERTGYSSTVFTLNLGDKFDTSKVTDMSNMFVSAGYSSMVFTLDLGDKFDTSNVTKMNDMFSSTGRSSTVFTLDLGDKFDTSNVIYMGSMFSSTGRSSTVFTLDLGDKFNTSNVTGMASMFSNTGYANTTLELDLSTFDFSTVSNYNGMLNGVRSTTKIWVKDAADRSWIIANGGSAQLSTANVLIKGA